MTKSNRGGARNTGRVMPSNTSQLNAIGFRRIRGIDVVTVCVWSGRYKRSIDKHGPREALRQIIEIRREHGLPAPSLATALRAYKHWKDNNDH